MDVEEVDSAEVRKTYGEPVSTAHDFCQGKFDSNYEEEEYGDEQIVEQKPVIKQKGLTANKAPKSQQGFINQEDPAGQPSLL